MQYKHNFISNLPFVIVISGNKRHSISIDKSKGGKEEGKGDVLPGNLAGKLQSLFTQTEKAEAPALKPLRRPKVSPSFGIHIHILH